MRKATKLILTNILPPVLITLVRVVFEAILRRGRVS